MDRFENKISLPKSGMSKGVDPRNLKENEYTHALNVNLNSVDGDFIDLTFEKSNEKSVQFPYGFKVIGRVNRLLTNYTYYFIYNPFSDVGAFGYVDNNVEGVKNFNMLLNDECAEEGFNFSLERPIQNPLITEEKTGGVIYFTDGYNPSKYIELDNIDTYFTKEIPCEDDQQVNCPLFDKMLIHSKYTLPEIKEVFVSEGGSLTKGSYSFLVVLSDSLGNEISEYFSLTQPVDVWEVGDSKESSKSIKVQMKPLQDSFTHYKLICFFKEKESRTTTILNVGVYSTTQEEVVISDLDYAQRVSLEKISYNNIKVKSSEGLTSANKSLLEYGLVFEEEINLQPIVNLLGSYLQWQTHVATEDLYQFGDKRSKFLGETRNEIVPYGIRFLKKGGTVTAIFPLVGREAKSSERQIVPETDLNRKSLEKTDSCNSSARAERWQYFNTATVTNNLTEEGEVEVTKEVIKNCTIDNVFKLKSGIIELTEDDLAESVEDYIEDNLQQCSGQLQQLGICQALNDTYEGAECEFETEAGCSQGSRIGQNTFISNIEESNRYNTYEDNMSSYSEKDNSLSVFNPFRISGNSYIQETESGTIKLYKRINNQGENNTKGTAKSVINNSQINFNSPYKVINCSDRNSLYTSEYLSPNNLLNGNFTNKITDGSQWFFTDINQGGSFITITRQVFSMLETPPTEDFQFSDKQRVSFFVEGNSTAVHSMIIDSDENTSFMLYKGQSGIVLKTSTSQSTITTANTNKIYFVVEQPTSSLIDDKCIKHASKGAYQIHGEALSVKGRFLSYKSITVGLNITYKVMCTYFEPIVNTCEVHPYQKGDFSYWESTIQYPDNPELYDSTKLVVREEDLPEAFKSDFKAKFVSGVNADGSLKIKDSFNLTCSPIRHFKFPDNNISPFMSKGELGDFSDSYIYPLGVTIDERVINMLLDIAVNSKLITKQQREDIYSYEIFRGSLVTNRSVVASGLLFDNRIYEENGKSVIYYNYPYNSFGADTINQVNAHPNLGKKGETFTFHSPETDYTNSVTATEIKLEGYQFGKSKGFFDYVEEHPKWTILTRKAESTAETLASLEVAVDIVQTASNAAGNVNSPWAIFGVSSGTNGVYSAIQIGLAVAWTALDAVNSVIFKYARYKQEWLTIFEGLGVSANMASYYYSYGHYNYLEPSLSDNSVRGLEVARYVKDGRLNITNRITKKKYDVNAIDREWTTFLAVGESTPFNYSGKFSVFDTDSITYMSKEGMSSEGKSNEVVKNIASGYAQLINYDANLHGNINSISWTTTSYIGDLKQPVSNCIPVFGGDTYITRHTLKRKLPIFLTTAMGQSGTTAFEYSFYNNIGRNPKFFVNYKTESGYSKNGVQMPTISSSYKLDNESSKRFYFTAPSKFYLYYYGVPSFLTETRINTNYREYGNSKYQDFYPNVGDLGRWTQESNVKLREPNYYKYAFTYSNQATPFNYRTLQNNFNRKYQDIVERSTNGVIISLPDNNENGQDKPWLKFRPLDFYEFDSKYGKLKELKGIENEAVLARFEHTAIIYNKVQSTVDDGNSPSTYLGGNSIFQRRTVSFVNSEMGFGGTQQRESLSNEYGHFYVDNKRGQVIQIPSGGGNMVDISNVNSAGRPTNMKDWFKKHLPFKLINSNIIGAENIPTDNTYNGVGTTFGYDALHKRIFITKKDYLPISECQIYYENGNFYTDNCESPKISCPEGYTYDSKTDSCKKVTYLDPCPKGYQYNSSTQMCEPDTKDIPFEGAPIEEKPKYLISLDNTEYFKDISWTVAYYPEYGQYGSFYSFTPNYYVNHFKSFETGNNQLESVWEHNKTNKTFGVFYGNKYPMEVETVTKAGLTSYLGNVSLLTEAKKYLDNGDFILNKELTFNKSIIYNRKECSGLLHLDFIKGHTRYLSKYPLSVSLKEQRIPLTPTENMFNYNYIFNRAVKNSELPLISNDENEISIDVNNVSFNQKGQLERLNGDYFLNRLIFDKDNEHALTIKLQKSLTNLDNL